ncbi:MAG: Rieske (2Fe-2S) protein [bacterium]|nr:MAG: Rieske (2Fe-2S) protein [bacterium]
MDQKNSVTKHRRIDYLIGTAALLLVGTFLYPPLQILWPRVHLPIESSLMVPVSDEAGLLPGSSLPFVYQGRRYLAINLNGRLYALSGVCSEGSGILHWDRSRRLLVCPSHGGTYDVHGNVVSGPSHNPLTVLNIRVAGGKIYAGR